MNTINSNHLPGLQESVILAYSEISEQNKLDNPFLDLELISETRNKKRIYEHVSSRELLLKMLISKGINPKDFAIQKTADGKPFAMHNVERVHLSFSHTNEWVICGFSSDLDIGIDAEKVERSFRPELLQRIASDEEVNELKECEPIAIWTMKEAVVKSLGIGIRRDLREIRIKKEKTGYRFYGSNSTLQIVTATVQKHQISVAWEIS